MDTKETNKKPFTEFPPVSTKEWEAKIIEDLKGANYEKKLIWKTDEGISVKPYYRAEHISHLPHLGAMPGNYPFVRGNKVKDNSWEIRECVDVSNLKDANRIAVHALAKGSTSLSLDVSEVVSVADLAGLLQNIPLAGTDIHYFGSRNYQELLSHLIEHCEKINFNPTLLRGSFDFDPISYVLLNGDFYHNESSGFNQAYNLLQRGNIVAPKLRLISINGHYFHNAGANITQELAFAMASASEYLAFLTEKGLKTDDITPHFNFILSSGSTYFMEIAKFRAARLLWARIVEQYKPEKPESMMSYIQAITSSWKMTVYDSYVNMLRTTTGAMAAAIAGVDSITVNPFDAPFKDASEFSRRMARNQQILLREESYLDKVIDPSAGSYYIEQLTNSIASHAWDLFVKVEQMGGMIQAVKQGFVQDEVEKSALQCQQDLAKRRLVMLGTNQHPNLDECMLENIQEELLNENDLQKTKTKYKTLTLGRATEAFEDLRLATEIYTEAGNEQPKVFLFTIGNPTMRKARAGFSSGFFACAGYKIIDNPGFNTIEEGVKVISENQPSIIVICSSDEEYLDLVPEIYKQLKDSGNQSILVLAGYPKDQIESFKQAGIDEFIHMRSNVLETLSGFHRKLGIIDAF